MQRSKPQRKSTKGKTAKNKATPLARRSTSGGGLVELVPNGLVCAEGMDRGQWKELFDNLLDQETQLQWRIGDALLYARITFGEPFIAALQLNNYRKALISCAELFPVPFRTATPFTFFMVAYEQSGHFCREDLLKLINQAREKGFGVRAFRKALRELRASIDRTGIQDRSSFTDPGYLEIQNVITFLSTHPPAEQKPAWVLFMRERLKPVKDYYDQLEGVAMSADEIIANAQ